MPIVTLPDGSKKEFEKSITIDELSNSIGAGLAKATVAGKINGILVDSDTLSPFSYDWITNDYTDDQEHIIYVIAYDIEGNFSHHQPIAVFVDNNDDIQPYGQIQNPIPGQIVNGVITIQMSAEDNVAINNIELSINGNIVDSFEDGIELALNTIENGKAMNLLEKFVRNVGDIEKLKEITDG